MNKTANGAWQKKQLSHVLNDHGGDDESLTQAQLAVLNN